LVLKELRETFEALKISKKLGLDQSNKITEKALKENNELIAIFVKTLKTARENLNDSKT